jgi:outer membrane protein, multidrug efflux system
VKRLLYGTLLLLAACVTPPPKLAPPSLPQAVPLDANGQGTAWPAREWWRDFHDDTLDELIARALANGPDLAIAAARFDEARAGVKQAQAEGGLSTALAADASRQRLSDYGLIPPKFLGYHWYNQFDLGLEASYTLDWWGRNRASVAASTGDAVAAAADRDAAALTLASSTAELYFGWQSDSARRELAAQELAAAEQRLQIVTARVNANVERDDAREQVELEVLDARDHREELDTSAQLRLIALAAMLGCTPAELPPLTVRALPELHTELPATASIDLIARRPDIVAARARVEAAASRVEVARDDFFPDISLSALAGVSSQDLGKLIESASRVPMIKAAFHVPLFASGTLHAQYSYSAASLAQYTAAYRSAVYTAAREVNTQLAVRQRALDQAQLRAAQLAAADALRHAAGQRTAQGIEDARGELSATQHWLSDSEAQTQTRIDAIDAELGLIRALGGGYRMEAQP